MRFRELRQEPNKSESDIHPSKELLQKRQRRQLRTQETDAPVFASTGKKLLDCY